MKQKPTSQYWILSTLAALAGSASLCLAANISYTFDTDVQGWYADGGHGSVVWDGTQGRGGLGCLKCTIVAGTDTEVDPRINVAYDTSTAFDIEFDMMIDPASGTSGGSYGNLQIADYDPAYTWHSEWYGGLGSSGGPFSTWQHVKIPFSPAYGPRVSLQMQLVSWSGAYSADAIFYIDNIVIQDGTPPNKVVLFDGAWPEKCVPESTWGGVSRVWSQDTTLHADGSIKEVVDYGSGNTGWSDAPGEFHSFPAPVDPTKYTYLDFDLYLDAPTGLPSYGQYEFAYWYSWIGLGAAPLSAANIGTWTHYSLPLAAPGANNPQGFVFHPGGNNLSGVFTYYIDNVTLWKPAAPPTMVSAVPEAAPTGKGAEILMNVKNNQWQRDAICVPSATPDYSWVSRTPISYSFTIANYPDAVQHYGFGSHLYIVNESTIPASGAWNETYGACDWNAADLVAFTVENSAAGGVIVRLNWKTGSPGANCPDANRVVDTTGTTAVGTWTLTFDTDTTGTVTGPGGFTASFTLPAAVATQFDPNGAAALSFIQFGMGQNDTANNNHNYNASGVFSAISMSGGLYAFNETFPGPTLTSGGTAWRTTGGAVQWVPAGIGGWVTWTTPDDLFGLQVSGNLSTWTDVGVVSSHMEGAHKVAGVAAADWPAGNAAFFRLKKP